MDPRERRALKALALMAQQYLEHEDGMLDHLAMSAGEHALKVLHEHGLVDGVERGAKWTDKGQEFLRRC